MRPSALVALGFLGGALISMPQPATSQSAADLDAYSCYVAIYATMDSYNGIENKVKVYQSYFKAIGKFGDATGVYIQNIDLRPDYKLRKRLMNAAVPLPVMKKLADACIASPRKDHSGLLKAYAAQIETPELAAARQQEAARSRAEYAARQAAIAASSSSYSSQGASESRPAAQVDPRDAQCRSIMDQGVARSTKDMMAARKWVEAWLKMGGSGPVMGGDYVRSGCNTINSTINRLNAEQCHPDYANALVKFRNGYYIGLPSGAMLNCS
ncbi:MAG: hypothetical protein ACKOPQ_08185 [Novosphingobium sp.]